MAIQMKENFKNWKDSKLFITLSSIIATAVCLITIFFIAVIPTWIEKYRNENNKLKELVPEYPKLVKKIEEKDNAILQLKAELNALRMENLFKDGVPYPLGFREIKLGDNISKVKTIYRGNKIEEDEVGSSFDVQIGHNLFSSIYFGNALNEGKVSFMIFHFKEQGKLSYETLKRKLIEAFPKFHYKEFKNKKNKINFIMKNVNGLDIELNEIGMTINKE